VDKLAVVGFLVVATTLESTGDAIVRMGLSQEGFVGSVWDVVGILSGIISDKLIITYYAAISNC
jgi:hypothetical protein